MNEQKQVKTSVIARLAQFIHRYFMYLLIASYIVAGLAPELGLWMREIRFGSINLPGMGETKISLSLVMLSFLLFNAGLGIRAQELLKLRKKPQILLAGFFANLLVPILLIICLLGLMGLWHSQDELHNLLVGLALIVAMPIAGSSAAWSQNANGNLSLSLGLILLSTVLSPLTTPLVLHLFGFFTKGDYSEDLHEMAQQGTNAFLCLTVVFPSLSGMAMRWLLGETRINAIKSILKLSNFTVLILLNYSNASTSLPQAFRSPDWDFLSLIFFTTLVVCSVAYFAGWLIAFAFNTDSADKASLVFSLGMNNNGTGLVLAATALSDHPAVMLPMIFYTLVQQVLAAIIDSHFFKDEEDTAS